MPQIASISENPAPMSGKQPIGTILPDMSKMEANYLDLQVLEKAREITESSVQETLATIVGPQYDPKEDLKWFASGQLEIQSFIRQYVAIWRKQVIGSGATRTEAENLAKFYEPNSTPTIVLVPKDLEYHKKHLDLLHYLESLQSKGAITNPDLEEIMLQHYELELHSNELLGHDGEIVVVCGGELFFGENLNDAIQKAREKYGNKPYFSETVNMVDYPTPFD
ncbi:MAG: hypothetical protein ACRECH_10425 [Nitrososphaerales archaeon]